MCPAWSGATARPCGLVSPDRGCLAPAAHAVGLLRQPPRMDTGGAGPRQVRRRELDGSWKSFHSARFVPLGCWNGRSCMQNAPECQDPVTTRQDQGQTCWDVSAKVKPSLVCPAATCRCRQEFVGARAKGHGSNPLQGGPGWQDRWRSPRPQSSGCSCIGWRRLARSLSQALKGATSSATALTAGSRLPSTSAGPKLPRATGTAGFRSDRPGLMATVEWLTTCCRRNRFLHLPTSLSVAR